MSSSRERGARSSVARAPFPHVPALDGLRGLALVGVLLFHASGALPGGYLGVDLFFVLSGYLITSLLVAEHATTGTIALGAFWVRRAKRLFPALLAMMPAIALYAALVARPSDLASLRAEAFAALAYVANWRAIFAHRSYWELFASPSPLEHTWSLSIEEQFYVVWPLVAMLALRLAGRRGVVVAASLGAFASMLALAWSFDPANPSRAYLGTDTRAAGILAGAALAALLPPGRASASGARRLDTLGLVAAVGLAGAWCTLRGTSVFLYRGGLWATELGALVLVACAVRAPEGVVARALASRPLRALGGISYGVYLWHWPVNVVLTSERAHVTGLALQALRFASTFAIAIASHHVVETPVRKRGLPFGKPWIVAPAALAITSLAIVAGTRARPDPALARAFFTDATNGASSLPVATPERRLLVLGDSTANALGWALRGAGKGGIAVDLQGKDGCTLLMEAGCDRPSWPDRARASKADDVLVFLGGAFLHGIDADGGWQKACHPAWNERFERHLGEGLRALAATDARAWIVTVPYPLGRYDDASHRREVDCINASIKRAASTNDAARVLDLATWLCPDGACVRASGGVDVRPDGVHFDIQGAADLARWTIDRVES